MRPREVERSGTEQDSKVGESQCNSKVHTTFGMICILCFCSGIHVCFAFHY